MDPDAAWATLNDESLPVGDRTEAGYALLDWLESGGFRPEALRPPHVTTRYHALATVQRQIDYWETYR
jgi:hypothetical protein